MKVQGINRKRFIKFYKEWLSEPRHYNFMVDDSLKTLSSLFDTMSPELRIKQAIPLMLIGVYNFAKGGYDCFNDARLGWKTIKKAILYQYWEHRICYRFWQNPERRKKGSYDVNTTIPHLVALSKVITPIEGAWFAKYYATSVKDDNLYWNKDDDYGNKFPYFVIWLLGKLGFTNEFGDSKLFPPYNKIALSWNNSSDLANAIHIVCDHHLVSNTENSKGEMGDFFDHLAIINPIEIHLLEHVRKALGLDTPSVNHELLQEPFYPIPDFVNEISTEEIINEDKVLQQVIDLNKDWCNEKIQ
jgi:hypothetical protein